jgi:D-alanyl-D-alanine carboxypeptidase/D-alanyl-D-alanine-endopeptidase (penicillin-binding protein 4)
MGESGFPGQRIGTPVPMAPPRPGRSGSGVLLALILGWHALPVLAADPAPTAAGPRTGLAQRIDAHIGKASFADASWGIAVVSLDTGRTLYAHDADKLLVPASVGKLYTAALALDAFGPDHRIPTSLFATHKVGRDGELRGDLVLVGYGDPTLGMDPRVSWADVMATAVRKSGVRTVRGDLVGDATWFASPLHGRGWEASDLQSWYGAPASALSVDENIVRVEVRPAPQFGALAKIRFDPPESAPELENSLRTLRAPAPTDISLYRAPGDSILHAFGTIASNAAPQFYRLAVHDPALIAIGQLRAALLRQGVAVEGKSRSLYWPQRRDYELDSAQRVIDIWSPPISEIVNHGLKVSQNLYMQNLLLMVGARDADRERQSGTLSSRFSSSEERGIRALGAYLRRVGVPSEGVRMEDGPGLSRRDLTSARALTALLVHLGDLPSARSLRLGLPEAGVDGSLTGRMRNSAAMGRIHAKTGTMAFTYALAGYALTASGERLAFTILLNNYRRARDAARPSAELDAIAILLAELDTRSAP